MPIIPFRLLILILSLIGTGSSVADVVKPALVEISVFSDGGYRAEVRASIEALLTGINAKYKNTKQAPTAEEYDELRKMQPQQLMQAFQPFRQRMVDEISLKIDGKRMSAEITEVDIPARGYTKIPRISLIVLSGTLPVDARQLTWHYPAIFGDNAVRVRQVNELEQKYHWSSWQWIRDDSESQPFSLSEVANPRSTLDVVLDYSSAGFAHILPMGLDHILFVLGLYLFSTHMRPLLWQVTMFTVAHSITLGLAMNNIISLPATVVEPLIALSIAYVGIENIWHKTLHKSRLFIVFGFGLLHGMGFASMLADFGMPDNAFITALISFNIGVEFGQLAVIALAFMLTGMGFRNKHRYRHVITLPGSLLISIIGLYWTWDRLVFQ